MYVHFEVVFTKFFLSSHCIKIYKLKKKLAELDLTHKDPPYKKCSVRNTPLGAWGCTSWHLYFGGILL